MDRRFYDDNSMGIITTMRERRSAILRHAEKIGCNVIAAFEPENVFYLTRFWGEAIAVCTQNRTKLITPKLEFSRAEQVAVDCQVISTERGSELISSFIDEIKQGEKACTDLRDWATLEEIRRQSERKGKGNRRNVVVVNAEPFFQARRIKDDAEIRVIAKAAKILDSLFEICTEEIRTGVSERDLQAKLIYEAMKMGANPPSYKSTLNPLIIAGGPNGALPHAEVTDRKFRRSDMIVVDLTLRHAGYIADATRTFALGSVTAEMKKVYSIVQESQSAGLDVAKAGSTCAQVDSACRGLIRQHGYEMQFIHSTGHGIGLDVHEPPWLRMKNEEELRANMAVTVEPGIYIQNKFGVRIEDSIIITRGRPKLLNKFTKDLVALG